MKQEFIDYELHLQIFIDAGADAHARHLYGEPIKPEGYDEYKGLQNPENQVIKNKSKGVSYIENQPTQNKKVGINYDKDGIPEYLDAESYHFGEANPEWLKKHDKS